MKPPSLNDRQTVVALGVLRATLVILVFVSEHLVEAHQLADRLFPVALSLAAAYSVAWIMIGLRAPTGAAASAFTRAQPAVDVFLLSALAYTSGGAYSDVRKAFFVIPLAAAFSERPRCTARWSLIAVGAFTLQAALAGGHPQGAHNSWQQMTLNEDLYLAWIGAAATLMTLALRRRSAHTEQLADSRQRLVTQAIESVERERTRLADALHDAPVQNLIAARHDLRRAERDGDCESFIRLHEAIDLTIDELREEIFNLHPHVLDQVGLSAALDQVARRYAGGHDLDVTVDVDPEVGLAHRQVLFALGRELLANAVKHAQADGVRLTLAATDGGEVLEVTDDGCGIPEGRMRQALLDGHIGLAAVSERVAALGGTLSIATAPGEGTTIRVILPRTETPDARGLTGDISDRVTARDALRVSPT